jgi:hypothetical protein
MIPTKQRRLAEQDPFFDECCFKDCPSRNVQFHHPLRYGKNNKQISELFVPVCVLHHDKIHLTRNKYDVEYAKWVIISRIGVDYLMANYPKFPWDFELDRLNQIYGVWE